MTHAQSHGAMLVQTSIGSLEPMLSRMTRRLMYTCVKYLRPNVVAITMPRPWYLQDHDESRNVLLGDDSLEVMEVATVFPYFIHISFSLQYFKFVLIIKPSGWVRRDFSVRLLDPLAPIKQLIARP